jgi:hypothetical protein
MIPNGFCAAEVPSDPTQSFSASYEITNASIQLSQVTDQDNWQSDSQEMLEE